MESARSETYVIKYEIEPFNKSFRTTLHFDQLRCVMRHVLGVLMDLVDGVLVRTVHTTYNNRTTLVETIKIAAIHETCAPERVVYCAMPWISI